MDQKKLDRLIKLIKLANHNPNDGEANSAARAAARLLSEDNYSWVEKAKQNGGVPPKTQHEKTINLSKYKYDPTIGLTSINLTEQDINSSPKIRDLVYNLKREIEKIGTWAGVHRSEEPEFKSKRYYNPFATDSDFGWDTGFDWQAYKREWEAKRKETEKQYKQSKAQNWTWEGERSGSKGFRKEYKQVCRICTICGITRLTVDETTPYVCYECKRKT